MSSDALMVTKLGDLPPANFYAAILVSPRGGWSCGVSADPEAAMLEAKAKYDEADMAPGNAQGYVVGGDTPMAAAKAAIETAGVSIPGVRS